MEPNTDDSAARLLRCPVGCAFLLTVARDQVPIAQAVTPRHAFARAVVALDALNPWSGHFEQAVTAALSHGSSLKSLARAVADHPASRWWTAPIDCSRQVFISKNEMERASSRQLSPETIAHWEAYAQRPLSWRITSTLRGEFSCVDTVLGTGDWLNPEEYDRFAAEIEPTARVLEGASPADWHKLCVSFPSVNKDRNSPAGAGSLSPDWSRVASRWDGVHLTFAGLLTTPFVRHSSAAGTTMLWSWDAEGTTWLPGDFLRQGSPLAPLDPNASECRAVEPLLDDELGIPDRPSNASRVLYRRR
ncbi:MAG: hypothetical protein OXM03_09025 [Chloroflexota bacterium]|nr:hypothetical protein [Chloroflexota bacterium]MDE2840754.1 hypothetical protein [Chloroflexota bacterium]MDE2929892.1 hypothetical protein [Chloroflexota bacterium]